MAEVPRSVPCGECMRGWVGILANTVDAEHQAIHWAIPRELSIYERARKTNREIVSGQTETERNREKEREREDRKQTEKQRQRKDDTERVQG